MLTAVQNPIEAGAQTEGERAYLCTVETAAREALRNMTRLAPEPVYHPALVDDDTVIKPYVVLNGNTRGSSIHTLLSRIAA
ncbi:hypothetical protein [Streptomyces milbemycinicus]|uniref:hypothetical protein n=1 Tax=Streptomyces milbemycinicus TaxID=476552 RepID=UPI000A385200|nr:hypothetical protein [Streptomyces milbemycinicus]